MKINTKTVIIVALVAAAVYFVWRKLKESKAASAASGSGANTKTVEYILANIPFTSAEVKEIRYVNTASRSSAIWMENIQKKAAENGLTYDQQVVLDAIWLLYNRNGKWIAGPDGSASYGYKLQQKVINL